MWDSRGELYEDAGSCSVLDTDLASRDDRELLQREGVLGV